MKRLLACMVCLSLCSLLLCSCGSGSSDTSITSTVTQSESIPLTTASAEVPVGSDATTTALSASSDYGQLLCSIRWYFESGDAIWVFSQDGTYTKELVSEEYSGTWTLSDNGDQLQLSMTDGADGTTKTYQVTVNDDNTMDLLNTEGKQYRLIPFGA